MISSLAAMIQDAGLRGALFRGGAGSLAVKLAHTILTFTVSVVLARALGANGFGTYSFVYALVMTIAIPAQFGLPALVMRETAKLHVSERWDTILGLWRWGNKVAGLLSLVLALLAGGIACLFAARLTGIQLTTFLWGLILIPMVVLGDIRGAALRGLRHVVAGQLPEFIIRPGTLLLLVVGGMLLWPDQPLTPARAMVMHVFAGALAFVAGAWFLRLAQPTQITNCEPTSHNGQWLAAVLPLALVSGMQVINRYMDILMLGLFTNVNDVGVYRVVVQGAMLVVFGLQAVNMVVGPHFARLHSLKDMVQLQRVVTKSAQISFLMAFPVVAVFVLWGDEILGAVFGAEFARGHIPLAILAIGQLFHAAMGSVGYLLNMTGHERDTARGVTIGAGCNVILNLILIPSFGMNGAALATVLTLLIWNLVLRNAVQRRLGIKGGFGWI